jgi:hypothetical protein
LRWFGGEREQAARTFFNPQRARARETNVSWSTQFDAAIETPGGRKLVTLEDAARYIQRLAPVTRGRPEWQLAGTILIDAAEGRDFVMHARIAMLRALNAATPAQTKASKRARADKVIR